MKIKQLKSEQNQMRNTKVKKPECGQEVKEFFRTTNQRNGWREKTQASKRMSKEQAQKI